MKLQKICRVISVGTLMLLFVVLFQNCARSAFRPEAITQNSELNGNGGHYDGKISYVVLDIENLCEGGNPIRAQIDRIKNSFFMVRENCVDLPALELTASNVKLDLTEQFLTYESARYQRVRDPWLQPFNSKSIWNISIGSGAIWSASSEPDTMDIQTAGAELLVEQWSVPVFLANSTDSLKKVTSSNLVDQLIPIPFSFQLSTPANGINAFVLFDPTRRWLYQYSSCQATASGFDCGYGLKDDTCGAGIGGPDLGRGIIRKWEIESGEIKHSLRYSLPLSLVKATGTAWPAFANEYGGQASSFGNITYGSTVGIPSTVDINSLGLSRGGMILARALQNYGAIQRDNGGKSGGIKFFAEESAKALPEVAEIRADLEKIVSHLKIMRNQDALTPNGGGNPNQALLPEIDPNVCK